MNPKPYSEEWWFRKDIRNLLRKTTKFTLCDDK